MAAWSSRSFGSGRTVANVVPSAAEGHGRRVAALTCSLFPRRAHGHLARSLVGGPPRDDNDRILFTYRTRALPHLLYHSRLYSLQLGGRQ